MNRGVILLIDNFDSFSFNLYQQISRLATNIDIPVVVHRNNDLAIEELQSLKIKAVFLSPGPGGPLDAGICLELVNNLGATPLLGVCLGHQVLGLTGSGTVKHAPKPIHGKTSLVTHDGNGIFKGIPSPFHAARYHSLAVSDLPANSKLRIHAEADSGVIMALSHETLPRWGVQFHPESFLTEYGDRLIHNFLELYL